MIRYTLLSLTLLACNSFDSQSSGDEPNSSSFVIVEGDFESTPSEGVSSNELEQPSPVVMEIPEIGLKVIEVNQDSESEPEAQDEELENTDTDTIQTDDLQLMLHTNVEVDKYSALAQALTAQDRHRIAAVASFPSNLIHDALDTHDIKILHVDDQMLYTSEIIQSIVSATVQDSTIIYLPLYAQDISEVLFKAIDFAHKNEVRVYDVNGELL